MNNRFQYIKAKDYCVRVFDGTHSTPKPTEIGMPLVTSKHITPFTLLFDDAYKISIEDYNEINKRSQVSQWDILFSMIGTIGNLYLEKSEKIKYAIKNMGVFSCENKEKASFLYYYLQSPIAKQHIQSCLNGAVQKFLPLGALRDFPVPSYFDDYNKFIKILSIIDGKIDLNNRINKELEQMAKTLYDYWFVQFEFPDEFKRAYKSSNGLMTYNEVLKREIPAGWEVAPLKTLCDVKSGFPFSSDDYKINSKYKLITIKNVLDRYISVDTDNAIESIPSKMPEYCLLKEGNILLSLTGNVGRVGMVFGEKLLLNQRVGILNIKDLKWHSYLYLLFLQDSFRTLLEKISTGSNQKNLSPIETEALPIIIPPVDIIESFSKLTEPLLQKIIKNYQENHKLESLRDFLLPMLMNGQVKVEQ